MYFCHKCRKELNIRGAVGRKDICPNCQSYVHCCFNCRFHKPGGYNNCNEPQADFIVDKSQANFCDYFMIKDLSSPPVDHNEEVRWAKEKLDTLFKKQS